jgi:hypothetical protein
MKARRTPHRNERFISIISFLPFEMQAVVINRSGYQPLTAGQTDGFPFGRLNGRQHQEVYRNIPDFSSRHF